MDKCYFLDLAGYIAWTDNKIIKWLDQISEERWEQNITSSFNSIKQTALHIASAEKIWIDFWKNIPDPVFLSAEFDGTKNDLLKIWTKTSLQLKDFIEHYPEEEYRKQIIFKVRGEEWKMEFWQTFSHFINHATYHRGQLVTMLRQVGFENFSSTDLATYYRLSKNNSA
ncbi:DinB family protein [Flavobacterium sp. DG1-102-2]|uniref:DinB family protein n=1 Tax=Flavobacterium sp. DG1-102-2 TaxID=3081663 RepID=UPI00294A3778|nr:DinB family protein [Flavobacterium sp. DG1-102-2]MDV6167923.1 DinB family protein [Flavobacterium sp. DG1-102-2]